MPKNSQINQTFRGVEILKWENAGNLEALKVNAFVMIPIIWNIFFK